MCISDIAQQAKLDKKSANKYFSAENFTEQLLNDFLFLNLSFWALKNPEFQKLIQMLQSGTLMPDRHWFGNLVKMWHQNIQETLLTELEWTIKISIALDNWISLNHLVFMGVTAYFINKNWNYQKILLVFWSLHDQHTD